MPGGIGTIHARAVALRAKASSDRRSYSERLLPFYMWEDEGGHCLYDQRSGGDRRRLHEFAESVQALREAEREPLIRCIREMGEEIERLRLDNELLRKNSTSREAPRLA